MDRELSGKVAIVIGASAGIGRAYALALAEAGATVIAAARSLGPPTGEVNNTLNQVVNASESLPGSVHAQVCDAQVEADIASTIDRAMADFRRVDVLVNNAGLMTQFDPFAITNEDWQRIMGLNVRGPYCAIKHAVPHMQRQGSGSIVNITAKVAEFLPRTFGAFHDGSLLYGASKAALNRMTFFFSELLKADGIAVNGLSPGVVATDTALETTPNLRELGGKEPTAEALGPALVYLAQQSAATLTGQILHTDQFGKSWGLLKLEAEAPA